MKYILEENIALRTWIFVPYAYYNKNEINAKRLTKEEFEFLLLCDGEHDLEETELSKNLFERHFIKIANYNEKLTEWQNYKVYANRYMPRIEIQLTEKCNFNCLHCFEAIDNNPSKNEFSLDKINEIIEDANRCGVHCIDITGGEPFLHPNFMEIIENIYKHNMIVSEVLTNASLITQDILDKLKKLGCNPLIRTSFDGLGAHDIIRNKKGSEKEVIEKIKLLKKNNFKVCVHMQLNKLTSNVIVDSIKFLDSLNVDCIYIIRTFETPRWLLNLDNKNISIYEFLDIIYNTTKSILNTGLKADVKFGDILTIYNINNSYIYTKIYKYDDSLPYCRDAKGRIYIAVDGQIYPCAEMSGIMKVLNMKTDNIYEKRLYDILLDGKILELVNRPVINRYEKNEECRGCQYWKECIGGCPVVGLLFKHDYDKKDDLKCAFFKNGYKDKFEELFKKSGYSSIDNIIMEYK